MRTSTKRLWPRATPRRKINAPSCAPALAVELRGRVPHRLERSTGNVRACSTGNNLIDSQHQSPERELEATRQTLAEGLEALRLDPPAGATDKLARLALILAEWAPKMNLTGHRGPDAIARRLILDAAALGNVLPAFDVLVDLGSGAGFPGLPLAILHPDRSLVSVEARSRRVSFQKTIVRSLGLENVSIVHGRIEDLPPTPAQGVIAQAVAAPDKVIDWMLPWCRSDGWMAVPGSADSLASLPERPSSCETGEIRHYRVPLDGADRRVWVTRRRAVNPAATRD